MDLRTDSCLPFVIKPLATQGSSSFSPKGGGSAIPTPFLLSSHFLFGTEAPHYRYKDPSRISVLVPHGRLLPTLSCYFLSLTRSDFTREPWVCLPSLSQPSPLPDSLSGRFQPSKTHNDNSFILPKFSYGQLKQKAGMWLTGCSHVISLGWTLQYQVN